MLGLRVSFKLPTTMGYNHKREREIERIVGRKASGTGTGFGQRDVDFDFEAGEISEQRCEEISRDLIAAGYKAHWI